MIDYNRLPKRELRDLLPPAEVYKLDAMACQARAALAQADRAYEEGRDADAGDWEVLAEGLLETLEARVDAIEEDIVIDDTEPQDWVFTADDPADYLANTYYCFIMKIPPCHMYTAAEVARWLRGYLEKWSGGPLAPGVTDEQLWEAAHEAYMAKMARMRRIIRTG